MQLTEFPNFGERVIAAFMSETPNGESYDEPIGISYYENTLEICITHGDHYINIQADDVDKFCRLLKKAAKLSKEQK